MKDSDIILFGYKVLSYIGIRNTYSYKYTPSIDNTVSIKETNPHTNIIIKDFIYLTNQYLENTNIRIWDKEAFSMAVVFEVLEHYNYKFNPINILNDFDISLDRVDKHSYRIRQFAKLNYWKDNPEYWDNKLKENIKLKEVKNGKRSK